MFLFLSLRFLTRKIHLLWDMRTACFQWFLSCGWCFPKTLAHVLILAFLFHSKLRPNEFGGHHRTGTSVNGVQTPKWEITPKRVQTSFFALRKPFWAMFDPSCLKFLGWGAKYGVIYGTCWGINLGTFPCFGQLRNSTLNSNFNSQLKLRSLDTSLFLQPAICCPFWASRSNKEKHFLLLAHFVCFKIHHCQHIFCGLNKIHET